jgi:hypothetical protein
MPFKKTGPNSYRSPSGKKFTKKQVVAYYATNGFKKPIRKKGKYGPRSKRG